MPKFYCDYCGVYLTHSSPSGRRQHGKGRKHINNKIEYYSQFLLEQTQSKLGGSQPQANPYMRPNMLPPQPGMQMPLQIPKPLLLGGEGLAQGGIQQPMLMAQQLPTINLPGIQPSTITSIQLQNQQQMPLQQQQQQQLSQPPTLFPPQQFPLQQLAPKQMQQLPLQGLASLVPPPNPQQMLGILPTQQLQNQQQMKPNSSSSLIIQQPPQNINILNLQKPNINLQQNPQQVQDFQGIKLQMLPLGQTSQNKQI